jgi:hypothetical protein
MEATGRSDNLKTIVGMLLNKDNKQIQQQSGVHVEVSIQDVNAPILPTRSLPKVTVISAPTSRPSTPSPVDKIHVVVRLFERDYINYSIGKK